MVIFLQVYEQCKRRFSFNSTDEAVKVEIYFESFCPDSQHFIVTQLEPTFSKLMHTDILMPTLVPYGKAHVSLLHLLDYQEKSFTLDYAKHCLIYK